MLSAQGTLLCLLRMLEMFGFRMVADPDRIDVLIQSGDFHRAAKTKAAPHRGHGDAGFGEDRAKARQLAGSGQSQRIALSGLHRQMKSQSLCDASGP